MLTYGKVNSYLFFQNPENYLGSNHCKCMITAVTITRNLEQNIPRDFSQSKTFTHLIYFPAKILIVHHNFRGQYHLSHSKNLHLNRCHCHYHYCHLKNLILQIESLLLVYWPLVISFSIFWLDVLLM